MDYAKLTLTFPEAASRDEATGSLDGYNGTDSSETALSSPSTKTFPVDVRDRTATETQGKRVRLNISRRYTVTAVRTVLTQTNSIPCHRSIVNLAKWFHNNKGLQVSTYRYFVQ